ncbi:hypothetical protein EWM64_g1800 [Hericium alpestre]|uniref:Uncharacterized protein n=1 Tax=Hericium alpestre TaxID=135208 RepID=A0A4Z0A581_9AGAM|nr:hypothetical protein EWM64_g1800 [Hericium alpestre]
MVPTFAQTASLLVAVAGPLFYAQSVSAQLSAPDCTAPGWDWASNSLGQNPCLIAAYVEAVCDGGQFSIPALAPDHHYTGPTAGNGNQCLCNTVAYSLISACDMCQGNSPLQWSLWSFNCSSTSPDGTLPFLIPGGTRIPQWAFQNVTTSDLWNNVTAFQVGDGTESTATGGPTGSSSGSVSSPAPTSSETNGPEGGASHHSSHAGAIAGGVVGGVIGLALLTGAGIFFWLRHRRSQVPPSAAYASTGNGGPPMGQAGYEGPTTPFTPGETQEAPRKFYVRLRVL